MIPLGDFNLGATVYFTLTTIDGTGLPMVLAGGPVVSVYKDANVAQSVAGVALTVNFDGIVGLNHITIDTSADAAFYSAGSEFSVIVTTGTVGGVSIVGYSVGHFSIWNRSEISLDGVYVDSGGVAGTAFPIGTPAMPVDNLTDAVAIAAARNTRTIHIRDTVVAAPFNMPNYMIFGGDLNDVIQLGGFDFLGTTFNNIGIEGIGGGGIGTIEANNCRLNGTYHGVFRQCEIQSVVANGNSYFINCWTFNFPSIVSLQVGTDHMFIGQSGFLQLNDLALAGTDVWIYGHDLDLIIDVSCTAGRFIICGDVRITDNSVGTTLNDYTLPGQYLRPMSRIDLAATPDMGGTYNPATDSLEAISGVVGSIIVQNVDITEIHIP